VFQRIVILLDGSEVAERAVPYGLELARRFGAPLHLVRVVDGTQSTSTADALVTREMAAEYLERVRIWLVGRGIAATAEVREGESAYEILAATRVGDLLVMDSHGGVDSGTALLGIMTQVLARCASCPVLVIPPA
jgi:nucleotide-binding universal stress UspA family protein